MDLEAFAGRVVGESHAGVGADQAPRCLDVRVDVDRLVEVEPAVDAPVQAVDDVVGVLGAEAAEDDPTFGEQAVRARLGQVEQLGAGADEAAAVAIRRHARGDQQLVRDDARGLGHAVLVRILEEDDLVVAGGGAELRGVAFHLRTEVVGVDLRVGVGGRDPEATEAVPAHVDGLLEEGVLGEERDVQPRLELELGLGQGRQRGELGLGLRFRRQRARPARGEPDDVGLGFVHQRVELRDFDGVAPLLAAAEAEDVGVVRGAAAVEEQGVLAENLGAQFPLRFRLGVPARDVVAPAELPGEGGGQRPVALLVQVDAVVRALRELHAGVLPIPAHEGRLAFGRQFAEHLLILGQQGVVLGGVGQAGARGAKVFVADRADEHEADLALRTGLHDQFHQLGQFAAELGGAVVDAVAGGVRIQDRVVAAVGQVVEACGHAVAEDRDGGLHHGELLAEAVDALGDGIEAGARGAERAVAAVAEVAHGEVLAGEALAHTRLEVAVVILALDEHVADQQDAVAVVQDERRFGGEETRGEGAQGREEGEAGHGRIGRDLAEVASRL